MTEAIIQIQDLEKRFRSKNTEVYALQGINLTIRKGIFSGSSAKAAPGKARWCAASTCLSGLPAEASCSKAGTCAVWVPGICEIARRSMGMILQQFNLLMQRDG